MSFARTAGGRAFVRVRRLLLVATLVIVAAACGRVAEHGPALHRVTIHQLRFEPDSLTAAAGDTIEWTNHDVVPHTATATSGHWDSTVIQPGASWRTVVSAAGSERYGCLIHTTMQGRIDVR